MSLHETYNKKTAVTLHLATMKCTQKLKDCTKKKVAAPLQCTGKDLDAAWSPGVINTLLPDTKLTGPTAAAAA